MSVSIHIVHCIFLYISFNFTQYSWVFVFHLSDWTSTVRLLLVQIRFLVVPGDRTTVNVEPCLSFHYVLNITIFCRKRKTESSTQESSKSSSSSSEQEFLALGKKSKNKGKQKKKKDGTGKKRKRIRKMVSSDDDEDKTEAESDELEEMKKVRFWMQNDFFGGNNCCFFPSLDGNRLSIYPCIFTL